MKIEAGKPTPVFDYSQTERYTFMGIDQDFEKSRVVVLRVPYDSTTYDQPGARFGPQRIIEASRQLAHYDLEFDCEPVHEIGIYTAPELRPHKGSAYLNTKRIAGAVGEIMDSGKFPFTLGGEHSIAIGTIMAVSERVPDLTVVQIDAHLDQYDILEDTKYSHGCAMRRVVDDFGLPVTHIGSRSIDISERDYIVNKNLEGRVFSMRKLRQMSPSEQIARIVETIQSENVYITLDIDGLDICDMPATGTPEPGGLRFEQTLEIVRAVSQQKHVVGAELAEFSPIPGMTAYDKTAAQLAYKMITYAQLAKTVARHPML